MGSQADRVSKQKEQFIEVIPPGSEVTLNGIEATVSQLSVGPEGHVQYQCVWWDGNTRNSQWVDSWEPRVADKRKLRIGFHVAGSGTD